MFLSKLFHRKIDLYGITEGALRHYIGDVKGNQNEDEIIACKKLTRNIKLAKKIESDGIINTYMYGCLMIKVRVEDNKIVWIKNHHYPVSPYKIDNKKKNKLNVQLGIN